MSSYHNTTEDLGYPNAPGHRGGAAVAIYEGREYDLWAVTTLDPDTMVVTFIEEGDVHGIDYWSGRIKVVDLPSAPEVLLGEPDPLPCQWYSEGRDEEAWGEGWECSNKPVAMGNGVSGPGFVAMCAEHIKDDRENNRWGFAWWWPVRVSVKHLLDLVWEGELRPGRGY